MSQMPPEAAAEWPDHWSEEARLAVEDVLMARSDLAGAAYAALMSVGELLTTAAAHEEISRTAGHVSTGAAGHLVTHPSAIEGRLARVAANATLARLIAPEDGSPRSQAGRTMARARHAL